MTSKILSLLNKLEDPEIPLLGPNVKWLKLWGLLLPDNKSMKIFYMTMHSLIFIFIFTEFIDLWLVRSDMNQVLRNMKYAMLSSVNFPKIATFLAWQNCWKSIIQYVTDEDLERRKAFDRKNTRRIISKYTLYCRKVTYFYWLLMYSTVAMTILQPFIQHIIISYTHENNADNKYIEIVNSWIPIDKDTLLGYTLRIIYQTLVTLYAGGWISSYDTNAFAIAIFFKGELELLRNDSRNLFGTEVKPISKAEAKIKLVEYHRRHENLITYSRLFGSCLSPIMLLYVIVCSVMLCATAYQITFETSAFQKFITAEYLIFGVSQLFLYCWHSNEVLYVSRDLTLGPYESNWWSRDLSEQRDVYILTDQFNKNIVFSAGPFSDITVATFISILKGAYSYYTLLSQSQTK